MQHIKNIIIILLSDTQGYEPQVLEGALNTKIKKIKLY